MFLLPLLLLLFSCCWSSSSWVFLNFYFHGQRQWLSAFWSLKIQEETHCSCIDLSFCDVCVSLADETNWNALFFLFFSSFSFARWKQKKSNHQILFSFSVPMLFQKNTRVINNKQWVHSDLKFSKKQQNMQDIVQSSFSDAFLSGHDFCSESMQKNLSIFLKREKEQQNYLQ